MENFERVAKTFQFLKTFTAAIQDHLDKNIRHRQFVNPLQHNSLYCTARLANLEGILSLSVLSTILVKAGLITLAAQE